MRRTIAALAVLALLAYLAVAVAPSVARTDTDLAEVELIPPMTAERPPPTTTAAPPTTTTLPTPPPTTTTTARLSCAQMDCGTGVASYRTPGELRSTAYCLTGTMASGRPTYVGAVASNAYALGTRVTADPNPWGDPGMVFTVEDRHQSSDGSGYPTEFDFAMPNECDRALQWGNTIHVTVTVVG